MWEISKEFACCYGHRVHTQKLNTEYSLDNACVCRHLHGHQMKVLVHLKGDTLVDGMVTDFKHLNWFKKFIDDVVDHKFIIDKNDPLFKVLLPHEVEFKEFKEGYSIVDTNSLSPVDVAETPALFEMYEGYVIVDFVPTSENLSKWFYDIVSAKMANLGVQVSRIEFYETPKSRSSYNFIDD